VEDLMGYFYELSAASLALAITVTSAMGALAAGQPPCNPERPANPAAALQALLDGNARWAVEKQQRPGQDSARRHCVFKNGQTPFAAILSCSDSRVPPEFLFDQGVGDLFVVRVAGNSINPMGLESLAFAVEDRGAELIMVLGHQNCGAVKAAVESYPKPAQEFVHAIYGAVEKSKEIIRAAGGKADDKAALTSSAIDQHMIMQVEQLRQAPRFKDRIARGKLRIVGARYDLDTGRVTMLIQ
jgi:carbonic anhydrase